MQHTFIVAWSRATSYNSMPYTSRTDTDPVYEEAPREIDSRQGSYSNALRGYWDYDVTGTTFGRLRHVTENGEAGWGCTAYDVSAYTMPSGYDERLKNGVDTLIVLPAAQHSAGAVGMAQQSKPDINDIFEGAEGQVKCFYKSLILCAERDHELAEGLAELRKLNIPIQGHIHKTILKRYLRDLDKGTEEERVWNDVKFSLQGMLNRVQKIIAQHGRDIGDPTMQRFLELQEQDKMGH